MSRKSRPARRRWSLQEKADFVRRFHQSGKSQNRFAESIGVQPSLLSSWLAMERRGELPDPAPVLVPVRVTSAGAAIDVAPLEVLLHNRRVIRVPTGFCEATLCRLIEVLERC